jgi:O-antigen/teichoic acid export membrane protein
MRQVLFPRVTNLWEHKDIKGVKRYLGYSLRYLWILIVPLSFGLSAFAGHLLQKLATEEFARPGRLVVPIVATGIVCLGLDHVFRQILLIVKNTKLILYITIITGSLNILLAVLLVPNFGLVSAAFASLLCFLCSAILVIYSSRQYVTFSVDLVGLIKSILAACTMTGIIILSNPQGLWQLAGSGVLGAMVYFGVLFLIRGFSPKEIEFFKALFASLIAFPWRRLSKESQ